MADAKEKKVTAAKAEEKKPFVETRVDEFALSMFKAIGYEGRLPDSLVKFYKEFKARKDRMQPGRLSPEGFATVALLSDLQEGKIDSKSQAQEPASDEKPE